ncbi:MAG: GAF domain-containing protein [Dehalococcoidia bacterium]|nr:GAF domain-containing protein [Dehalococcoidia bacterium]MDW8120677.1 GAF domain-containing protein [Chloroflexota bacterium]
MSAPGLDDLFASNGADRLLRAIEQVALTHLSSLPTSAMMERLAGIVGEALDARVVIIRRYDPHQNVLEAVASWGLPLQEVPYPRIAVDRDFLGRLNALHTFSVVHTAEYPHDPAIRTLAERLGVQTSLGVPLRAGDTYLGSLRIHFPLKRTFSPQETALVQAVADRVAQALYHAQTLEREQSARRHAEALLAIAQAGLANAPLSEVLQGLATAIHKAVRADVVIRLWDESQQGLILGACTPPTPPGWTRPRVLPLDTFAGKAFRENRTLIATQFSRDDPLFRLFPSTFCATIAIPIPGGEHPLGTLALCWTHPYTPTADEQNLLETAAALAGQAIRRSQALEQECQARRHAESLLAIAKAGLAHAPLPDVLQGLAKVILVSLQADRVVLRLWNEKTQTLDLAAFAPALLEPILTPRHTHSQQTFSLRVFQEKRTLALPDIAHDPIARSTFHPSIVSTLGTPILSDGSPLGVIHVDWTSPHTPTPKEQTLLETAAALAGQAIRRATALEQEHQARRWAEALAQVLQEGTRSAPLPHILQRILVHMVAYWGATGGIVRLLDKATQSLVAVACVGYRMEDLTPQPIDGSGGGLSRIIFASRATRLYGYADLLQARSLTALLGHKMLLGAPLEIQGEPVGVLHLDWKEERDFTPEDIERFTLMVRTASQAVERVWLTEKAQQQARALQYQAAILAQVQDIITVTDLEGKVRYWSPGAERLLGIPSSATLGASLYSLLGGTPQDWEECVRHIAAGRIPATRSCPVTTSDGKTLWLECAMSPWYGSEGRVEGYIVVGRDVTPMRKMEIQMLQLEKMRALGQMAAGVAHDFNNFLAVIMGQAELALMDKTLSARQRQALEAIRRAAVDGAQVVRRLATLARLRSEGQAEPVDVQKVCRDALESTRFAWQERAARQGVTIHLATAFQDTPPAACTESELREVLINLILNAIDAMPQGGTLTLSCFTKDDRVCIAVQDTGTGIPPEVRSHLFEPFFTTKGPKGTGLGLAVSYSIIKRYGGDISVETEVGKGSTFTVSLPVAPAPSEQSPHAQQRTAAPRSLHLLVVEDDPAVADMLEHMLTSLGHRPRVFRDPAKALEAVGTQEWDALVTDLAMPGLTGWDVATYAKKARPTLPVLLLTGYGDHIDPHEAQAHGVDRVLGKPLSPQDLASALLAVVEGGSKAAPRG